MEKSKYEEAADKIDAILRELLEFHNGHARSPEFLTDWILVAAAHVDNPDGVSGTSYRRLVRDEQPPHSTLGLLEYELTKMRNFLVTEEQEE